MTKQLALGAVLGSIVLWWSFSNAYLLMQLGAILIGWFLASLVIAKIVRGKPA